MVPGLAATRFALSWAVMRCVFAFQICLIHICGPVWSTPQPGWMAETIFMSLTRAGSVGFMMLAGAILIRRGPVSPVSYLSHRFRKWLPVLFLAQGLYFLVGLWFGTESLDAANWFDVIEPTWYHIWFFYALATIYIMVVPMRLYAAWCDRLSPSRRVTALWTPIAVMMCGLAWFTIMRGGFWGDLRPANLVIYCGYAWAGYVLAVTFPRGAPSGWWMVIIGVSAAALATTLASEAAGTPVAFYFHRCTLFIAIVAMGQFLLLLRTSTAAWRPMTIERLNRLSRLTLGIFIIHPLVIVVLRWPHEWALVNSAEWITLPLAAMILFTLSGLISWTALRAFGLVRTPRAGIEGSSAHRA